MALKQTSLRKIMDITSAGIHVNKATATNSYISNSLNIEEFSDSLTKKDYSISNGLPTNRSELGVIIQELNTLKHETADVLNLINKSTHSTVKQTEDLVANMVTTKNNVSNIA